MHNLNGACICLLVCARRHFQNSLSCVSKIKTHYLVFQKSKLTSCVSKIKTHILCFKNQNSHPAFQKSKLAQKIKSKEKNNYFQYHMIHLWYRKSIL